MAKVRLKYNLALEFEGQDVKVKMKEPTGKTVRKLTAKVKDNDGNWVEQEPDGWAFLEAHNAQITVDDVEVEVLDIGTQMVYAIVEANTDFLDKR